MLLFITILIVFILISIGIIIRFKNVRRQRNSIQQRSYQVDHVPNIRKLIYFRDDLPFQPESKQILYVESTWNERLNEYINSHFEDIFKLFLSKGYTFFYLPRLQQTLTEKEFYDYNFPNVENLSIDNKKTELIYQSLLSFLRDDAEIKSGLIRYKMNAKGENMFSYYEFDDADIPEQLNNYLSLVGEDLFFSIGRPDNEEDTADFNFWKESKELIEEIKERVEKLRILGVEQWLLNDILKIKPMLSRLEITADFRILLTDYNKEITMTPLPKAVFLLFLNHPEGILFKNLSDYREELKVIYKKLTRTDSTEQINKSIIDCTDPGKNSINEKCSRIREAFLMHVNEELAQNYFITGNRSEVKRITLDRKMVINNAKM